MSKFTELVFADRTARRKTIGTIQEPEKAKKMDSSEERKRNRVALGLNPHTDEEQESLDAIEGEEGPTRVAAVETKLMKKFGVLRDDMDEVGDHVLDEQYEPRLLKALETLEKGKARILTPKTPTEPASPVKRRDYHRKSPK